MLDALGQSLQLDNYLTASFLQDTVCVPRVCQLTLSMAGICFLVWLLGVSGSWQRNVIAIQLAAVLALAACLTLLNSFARWLHTSGLSSSLLENYLYRQPLTPLKAVVAQIAVILQLATAV